MVSPGLPPAGAAPFAAAGRAAYAAALILLAACRGAGGHTSSADADSSGSARVVRNVQARYGSRDAVAAGAFTWTSRGVTWVLVDVQSAVQGLVQARAELWAGNDSGVVRMGQSDVLASAAEIGGWDFLDATGDGMPDLLGWVADSGGVQYPIFMPGARGAMSDQLEPNAPGWRISTEDDLAPRFFSGPRAVCAIQAWAEDPAPDGAPAGWRFLVIRPDGSLVAPTVTTPICL